MTKEKLVKLLVKNFINEDGWLDLSGLDFTDYILSVDISGIIVNGDLKQNRHIVRGSLQQGFHKVNGRLFQSKNEVNGTLFQNEHKVGGNLLQGSHEVGGNLLQRWHTVKGDFAEGGSVCGGEYLYEEPRKQLKEITEEELRRMGYKLK